MPIQQLQVLFSSSVRGIRDALVQNIGLVSVFRSLQCSGEADSDLEERVDHILVLIN